MKYLTFSGSRAGAPQPHIERTRAAMTTVSFLDCQHVAAEFRQSQPERHLSFEHAALAVKDIGGAALAGNHQHELGAVGLTFLHKTEQSGMRLVLRSAMQINAGVDVLGTAREPLFQPALDRYERRRCGGRCHSLASRWSRFRRSRTLWWSFHDIGSGEFDRLAFISAPPTPQRRDRARDLAPQDALLVADLPRHQPGLAFGFAKAAGSPRLRGFLAGGLAFSASSVITGFGSGNGICLPASTRSSSRGSSSTNRP